MIFDVIEGAAEREVTASRNLDAFAAATWRQPVGVRAETVDTGCEVLGQRFAAPILTAPCGMAGTVHPDAEPGVFRAAAERGLGAVLSTTATCSLETVAQRGGHRGGWFQLYFLGGRGGAEELLDRAAAAGYRNIVLTLDTAVPGIRPRDARHGLSLPMQWRVPPLLRLAPQVLARPRWLAGVARSPSTLGMGNGVRCVPGGGLGKLFDDVPTWADIAWIRDRWQGPVLVKGIVRPEDARRAVAEGADGIVVSNHGGRQLDGQPGALHSLAEVIDVVGGQVPVLMDGGVRTGADVARAVALGARAVLVGRAHLYGLAVAGSAGVGRVLDLLLEELERTMRLLGAADLAQLRTIPIELDGRNDCG